MKKKRVPAWLRKHVAVSNASYGRKIKADLAAIEQRAYEEFRALFEGLRDSYGFYARRGGSAEMFLELIVSCKSRHRSYPLANARGFIRACKDFDQRKRTTTTKGNRSSMNDIQGSIEEIRELHAEAALGAKLNPEVTQEHVSWLCDRMQRAVALIALVQPQVDDDTREQLEAFLCDEEEEQS